MSTKNVLQRAKRMKFKTLGSKKVQTGGIIPNCQFRSKTARLKTFTASQVDEVKDPSGLYYILPFQKGMNVKLAQGYLVNWDVQRQVWDHLFGKEMFKVDFAETNIIMTEPYFNFRSIQESMNEILFEEYQFHAICRINGGTLSAHKYLHEHPSELCCLVVDSGFSFTHIVPFYKGRAIKSGIRRLNVGGKLLSNHLKEIISYRQLHVMDETYVINQVKEDVCYVSQQFYKDMKVAQLKGEENTILTDYVLPDFSTIRKGYCKERKDMIWSGKYPSGEQVLRLSNERFAVPEIMFHPSDIGIQEMGIPEAIRCAVESLTPETWHGRLSNSQPREIMRKTCGAATLKYHEQPNCANKRPKTNCRWSSPPGLCYLCVTEMQPHMYQNIVLTGGSSLFPGYRDRVFADVRSLSPDEFRVSVTLPENPITHAWTAGSMLSRSPSFSSKHLVTRRQYEEQGQDACESKFDV